jgi:hypothetical protein
MPLNFTYVATNDTDQTCMSQSAFNPLNFNSFPAGKNWYAACKSKTQYTGGVRPGMCHSWYRCSSHLIAHKPVAGVKFRLILDMNIAGLPGTHSVSTQVSDAPCPIELPTNSV